MKIEMLVKSGNFGQDRNSGPYRHFRQNRNFAQKSKFGPKIETLFLHCI